VFSGRVFGRGVAADSTTSPNPTTETIPQVFEWALVWIIARAIFVVVAVVILAFGYAEPGAFRDTCNAIGLTALGLAVTVAVYAAWVRSWDRRFWRREIAEQQEEWDKESQSYTDAASVFRKSTKGP
jgi:membrane protein YdbS with pleckstrin-like domain